MQWYGIYVMLNCHGQSKTSIEEGNQIYEIGVIAGDIESFGCIHPDTIATHGD